MCANNPRILLCLIWNTKVCKWLLFSWRIPTVFWILKFRFYIFSSLQTSIWKLENKAVTLQAQRRFISHCVFCFSVAAEWMEVLFPRTRGKESVIEKLLAVKKRERIRWINLNSIYPSISLSDCKGWLARYKRRFCSAGPAHFFSSILFPSLTSLAFVTLFILLPWDFVWMCV